MTRDKLEKKVSKGLKRVFGGKKNLAGRRAARKAVKTAETTSKPGEGKRFAAVAKSAAAGGAANPGAVAAAIGRKKYGKAKFQKMAAAGRKRH